MRKDVILRDLLKVEGWRYLRRHQAKERGWPRESPFENGVQVSSRPRLSAVPSREKRRSCWSIMR